MPYYNLDHLDAVTRLIADLGISVDDDGHVGDDGSTYYGGFIQKGGETLSFTVRQPQGAGKPDAVEAMRQLVEEACLADRGIDTYAEERGITRPSQAVAYYGRAKEALDFLNDESPRRASCTPSFSAISSLLALTLRRATTEVSPTTRLNR